MTRYHRKTDHTADTAISRADKALPTIPRDRAEVLAEQASTRGDRLGYVLFAAAARRAA